MPTLEAAQEYERFSYDDGNERALTLDEAVKRARELKRSDSTNFYRIVPTDDGCIAFKVESVPVSSVYADFMARVAKTAGRYIRHVRKK